MEETQSLTYPSFNIDIEEWYDHFKNLHEKSIFSVNHTQHVNSRCDILVIRTIRNLKRDKSPGEDGIVPKLLQALDTNAIVLI